MHGCPNLTELDVSFNQIPTLAALAECLPHRNLTSLKFNDNLFSVFDNDQASYQ